MPSRSVLGNGSPPLDLGIGPVAESRLAFDRGAGYPAWTTVESAIAFRAGDSVDGESVGEEMVDQGGRGAGDPSRTLQRGRSRSATKVRVDRYRRDPLYPRIVRAVGVLLERGKVVAPVDVLVAMGLLDSARLEDWRLGRVPYLERVIRCNLTRLSRLLRILRLHAHDLKLVPSTTVYMRWGKGSKQRLRFTKTGDRGLEEAYSRHFIRRGEGPSRPPTPRHESD